MMSCSDEVIVLSAIGTAAKINLNFDLSRLQLAPGSSAQTSSTPGLASGTTDKSVPGGLEKERDKEKSLFVDISLANQANMKCLGFTEG